MWKPIKNYEQTYEVSNDGRVRRINRARSQKPREITQNTDHKGYLRAALSQDGKVRHFSVHSLVAQAFLGERLGDLTINHLDGDKTNNKVSNLEYCSRKENTQHAVSIGRISLSGAKITPEIVREIRSHYVKGTNSSLELATMFGLTRRTVVRVATGHFWRHVT